MPKVSTAHKEQVRQRLIDATRTVVQRDGHEGATTRAIVEEAGLSAGALYTYFSSKAELFEAVAEDVLGAQILIDVSMQGLFGFAAELLAQPDAPALAWFRGRMSHDPEVRAAQGRLNRYMVSTFAPLIAEAQAAGQIRTDIDPEALSELFDILVEGLNRRHATDTLATSFERVGSLATELLISAVTDNAGSRT